MTSPAVRVDTRGMMCPAPVIELRVAVTEHHDRPLRIVLLADDPAVEFDVPAWCRMTSNELVAMRCADGTWEFEIAVR
jgi:tRNA 2-thiouridine synthesizing protein A